jgi:hypothetical protein
LSLLAGGGQRNEQGNGQHTFHERLLRERLPFYPASPR